MTSEYPYSGSHYADEAEPQEAPYRREGAVYGREDAAYAQHDDGYGQVDPSYSRDERDYRRDEYAPDERDYRREQREYAPDERDYGQEDAGYAPQHGAEPQQPFSAFGGPAPEQAQQPFSAFGSPQRDQAQQSFSAFGNPQQEQPQQPFSAFGGPAPEQAQQPFSAFGSPQHDQAQQQPAQSDVPPPPAAGGTPARAAVRVPGLVVSGPEEASPPQQPRQAHGQVYGRGAATVYGAPQQQSTPPVDEPPAAPAAPAAPGVYGSSRVYGTPQAAPEPPAPQQIPAQRTSAVYGRRAPQPPDDERDVEQSNRYDEGSVHAPGGWEAMAPAHPVAPQPAAPAWDPEPRPVTSRASAAVAVPGNSGRATPPAAPSPAYGPPDADRDWEPPHQRTPWDEQRQGFERDEPPHRPGRDDAPRTPPAGPQFEQHGRQTQAPDSVEALQRGGRPSWQDQVGPIGGAVAPQQNPSGPRQQAMPYQAPHQPIPQQAMPQQSAPRQVPPPAAPAPESGQNSRMRTFKYVGVVVVLIALGVLALVYTSRTSMPQKGTCVARSGASFQPVSCSNADAYKVGDTVTDITACPDYQNQPNLAIGSKYICLAPAAGAKDTAPNTAPSTDPSSSPVPSPAAS